MTPLPCGCSLHRECEEAARLWQAARAAWLYGLDAYCLALRDWQLHRRGLTEADVQVCPGCGLERRKTAFPAGRRKCQSCFRGRRGSEG